MRIRTGYLLSASALALCLGSCGGDSNSNTVSNPSGTSGNSGGSAGTGGSGAANGGQNPLGGGTAATGGNSNRGGTGTGGAAGGAAGGATAADGPAAGAAMGGARTAGAMTGGTMMIMGGTVMNMGGARPATDMAPAASCSGMPPKLKFTQVAQAPSGVPAINSPIFLTQPKGDPRIYIVEQGGRIRIMKDGMLQPAPFLDIRRSIVSGGERGLLGLAFHPDYMTNGRFFVHYTRRGDDPYSMGNEGDIVIAEGKRSANNPEQAEAELKVLTTVGHSQYNNHNGGMVAFGPDGMLYVAIGDGGGGGDPLRAGQDKRTKLGKILRLDTAKANFIPDSGNAADADPFVWAWGLRNPWRFSFDRETGDLYVADVGQDEWEEVNFAPRGMGGKNYGWRIMEGTRCYGSANCNRDGLTLPIAEYPHKVVGNRRQGSITGGYVYRGQAIPCLRGRYIYGDHNFSEIYSFVQTNGQATMPVDLTADLSNATTPLSGLSSFGEDDKGELYVLSYNNSRIYRIDAE